VNERATIREKITKWQCIVQQGVSSQLNLESQRLVIEIGAMARRFLGRKPGVFGSLVFNGILLVVRFIRTLA
jgi:hypothetical protein